MKHLISLFALLFVMGINVVAIEGVPWNCKDLATAQQLAQASASTTNQSTKDRNAIMLAYLANPSAYDTLAKIEAKVTELCPHKSNIQRFDTISKLCFSQKNAAIGASMQSDMRKDLCPHYLIYCCGYASLVGRQLTAEERKEYYKEGLMICAGTEGNTAAEYATFALRKYALLIAKDENALVVPFMQELYRKLLPKVAISDKWKPAVVIAGLILKERGVNVE